MKKIYNKKKYWAKIRAKKKKKKQLAAATPVAPLPRYNKLTLTCSKAIQKYRQRLEFMENAEAASEENTPTPGYTFGMRLQRIREDKGLIVYEMAKSMEIEPSTWQYYEMDVTTPATTIIMKFCELYNVNPRWLLTNCGEIYGKEQQEGMNASINRQNG